MNKEHAIQDKGGPLMQIIRGHTFYVDNQTPFWNHKDAIRTVLFVNRFSIGRNQTVDDITTTACEASLKPHIQRIKLFMLNGMRFSGEIYVQRTLRK